jgi:tripartite-type tricarboxylate transporter receptor subunit TctC
MKMDCLMIKICTFIFIGFFFSNAITVASNAEPRKCLSIRVIVPYSAGTATDLILRAYAETINRHSSGSLLKVLNKTQKSVIEKNMKGRPDGCQILAVTQSLVSNFLTDKAYVEWSSFTPIAMLSRTPLAVVARGNLKDANLPNIIEVGLENPNIISVGESLSPLEQMFRMNFEDTTGVKFKVNIYQTARQSFLALLGTKLDIGIVSISAAKRRLDLKQLKVLALTDGLKNTKLVGVPTLKDQGIDVSFGVDRGVVAPMGTSPEIVAKIMERFQKAAEDQDLIDRLTKINTKVMFLDSDSYTQYFENLTADWSEMIMRSTQKLGRNPA